MPTRRRALPAALALALLVPLGGAALTSASSAPESDRTAGQAQGEPRYDATIRRTRHGIPHITGRSFGDLGFGSGYATAQTSACTLVDTVLTGRGERSRWFGPDAEYNDQVTLQASNLQVDAFVTDLRNRRVVERMLADRENGPSRQARAIVRGYVAGANAWLDEVGADGVSDPACSGQPYLEQRATALDLWYGVYLANLLASSGVFVKEIVDATPPSPGDPGVPAAGRAADVDRDRLLAGLGRDPETPFGSNATAVGAEHTTTGRGMVLGNPHFPWRGRYSFTQQHLTIPGRYDVAGASLIGSPVVNIGWNDDVAWSHTVSTAFRFTPYEYRLLGPTTYATDGGTAELERREVEVTVKTADGLEQVTEDVYRTPEGYVVDAPDVLMPWTAASVWAIRDANAEHLRTIDTFLDMGRADGVRDLIRRQDRQGGMPWVNTTAADRRGGVVYADHSVVPNVPDALAEQCMTGTGRLLFELAGLPGLDGTRAGSGCGWQTDDDSVRPGVFGPGALPETFRRDWVGNANDSYWTPNDRERLEGFARIIGCEQCQRTMRTRMVYRYVTDRLGRQQGNRVSPKVLRGWQHRNRLMAAEVMREDGDLDTVCDATGETEACAVLAAWDGRSEADSVGTHLFEAFVARLPKEGAWQVPFSPDEPLTTPRDLNELNPLVIEVMDEAIAAVRDAGVALDAPWGSLQVAGDRGAPPLPLGGGTGDAVGNANALASRWVRDNDDRYRPITYGSSHIQAVAFTDRGVRPRTILTYGQSENPRSPWSADQTRLFSQERWVRFPWTDRQIERDLVRRWRVVG
ncbi:penicillin acylase family protein [Nocardioides coralli]|uniref:penicillin acylase family protein n=1 Tax=Nocardioides coralli TaxID=2872154 RepID=UPI001CA38E32|nr:penicillin acylase family protein [Nocardioides coralli]QZY28356.1 penicillin acylase family protein [Nocardioides coralli]